MAGAGAGTPSVSMSLIEPSSTEKSTLVTVAGCANRALPSLANLSSTVPGDPRTVGTTFRATLSSAARTHTTATSFASNEKSAMRRAPQLSKHRCRLLNPLVARAAVWVHSRVGSPAMGRGAAVAASVASGAAASVASTAAWGSPLRLWPPRRRRWRIRSNDVIPFSAQAVWAHAFGRDQPLAGPA